MQGLRSNCVFFTRTKSRRPSHSPILFIIHQMNSHHQNPLTRPSLILRLRNPSDLEAWEEFVAIYQPVIFALARRRGLQESDSDDVTQEVLSRVANRISDWDPDPQKGSFRAWLSTVTRNTAIQFFRETNRRAVTGVDSRIDRIPQPSTNGKFQDEEFDLERERQLFLWAARKVEARLESKTWQAFWLTAVECQEVSSVAEQLQTTRAQIYVARSRVMRLMKKTVEQTQFDPIDDRGRDDEI